MKAVVRAVRTRYVIMKGLSAAATGGSRMRREQGQETGWYRGEDSSHVCMYGHAARGIFCVVDRIAP